MKSFYKWVARLPNGIDKYRFATTWYLVGGLMFFCHLLDSGLPLKTALRCAWGYWEKIFLPYKRRIRRPTKGGISSLHAGNRQAQGGVGRQDSDV